MYELNRARLVGVGPRAARYTDVTLDLSGLGDPVDRATLFDDAQRRPSPFSLLMLENGGGKSVMLKLLFSVVLPGRRKTVGGASMDRFVLDGDTSHVALEWMNVRTGETLVTGVVFQRRTRTASDNNPLTEARYSFRPGDGLDLSTLPVTDAGRRVRLEGFKAAVDEANRADPALQLAWLGADQGRWREHLTDNGIDPDLFDIQRHMNVDEGEAAKAFKYASSKEFVDWMLTTLTDREDTITVAQTFTTFAQNLADRDQMMLERDFLVGTIAGLEPLGQAHAARTDADRAAAAADTEATELAAGLAARENAEVQAGALLEQQVADAAREVTAKETARDNARAVVNEVKLRTLRLRHQAATQAAAIAQEELDAARLEVEAWELLPLLGRRDQAAARAQELAGQIATTNEAAKPLLTRRDETAAALLAKLTAEATAADESAAALDAAAKESAAEAERQRRRENQASTDAARAVERRRAAAEKVAAAAARIGEEIETGLVPPGTRPENISGLLEAAQAAHREAMDMLTARREDKEDAGTAKQAADVAAAAALTAHTEAMHIAERVASTLQDVENAAAALVALPAIEDVLGDGEDTNEESGTDSPMTPAGAATVLDDAVERVTTELGRTLEGLRGKEAELEIERLRDKRILDALGTDGLLPPREDVTAAVTVLAEAGIVAYPGWQYLAESLPATQRRGVIAARPALVDGLVVLEKEKFRAARTVLADAELLPAAAVLVDAAAVLVDAATDAPGTGRSGFVVDPSPAMFDRDAADVERALVLERADSRTAEQAVVLDRSGGVVAAIERLRQWRIDNPFGRLTRLREAAATARTEADAATVEHTNRAASAVDAEQALETAQAAVTASGEAERSADTQARLLAGLLRLVAGSVQASVDIAGFEEQRATHQAEAEAATEARVEAESKSREASASATLAGLRGDQHRTEIGQVSSTSGQVAAAVPSEPLSVLRDEANAAQQVYAAAQIDVDLKAEADAAARAVQDLRDDVAARDSAVVQTAETLRVKPRAADPGLWAAETRAARTRWTDITARHTNLISRSSELAVKVQGAEPQDGSTSWVPSLSAELTPATPEEGLELENVARDRQSAAQRALDETAAQHASSREALDTATDAARTFKAASGPLLALLPTAPAPATTPWGGGPGLIDDVVSTIVTQLRATRTTAQACREQVSAAVTDLMDYANRNEFESLATPARRAIVNSPADQLAERASEFGRQLNGRLATLTHDLSTIEEIRANIVKRLAAIVEMALKTLRAATRLSELPEDLDEWAGKQFLRIRFADPSATEVSVRVGEVVDRTAGEFAARREASGTARTQDGLALLLGCVHGTVPNGFKVDVLKPDTVLRDERVSIEEISNVFSGGQELTAAIVLYCTLAALRGQERGRQRTRHSGVLFLDNPIGRANASYLLDLQRSVARSLGVQLVYTTGISDDRVTAAFPLWVRLRNDADLRAGLKHIRVAESMRAQLPAGYTAEDLADPDTAPGAVSATRVYRRPARPPAGRV